MISGYLARDTWLHRIPAGAKLAMLAAASMAILPVEDWRILACGLAGVLALYATLGREAFGRVRMLKPLLPLLLIVLIFHGFAGNWDTGAGAVARLLMMVLLADLVTMSTTMQAMMEALTPVLSVLRPLGVDPRKLSLAVSLVVRFVPVLSANWQARTEAWRARTGRRPSWRLVGPFIGETMRMADQVAEALDARGFGRSGRA